MPVIFELCVDEMSSGDQPRNWNNPTSAARIPTTASVLHRVTFPFISLIDIKALTDITTYISAVNSPASNPAGTRPHQLRCGRIDSEAEIIETAVTAAIALRIANTGLFALGETEIRPGFRSRFRPCFQFGISLTRQCVVLEA